jgi:hypothetical protein
MVLKGPRFAKDRLNASTGERSDKPPRAPGFMKPLTRNMLNEDGLPAIIFLLIVAGYETKVNLTGNGMLALLEHPDRMERLAQDPTLIKPAAEELLRYSSLSRWQQNERTPASRSPEDHSCSWRSSRPTVTKRSSPTPTASTSRAT